MSMILNQEINVIDVIPDVETKHGNGRVLLLVNIYDKTSKVFLNAPIKNMFVDLWNKGVTKVHTKFIDLGSKHYDIDEDCTNILEIDGRKIISLNGSAVYEDTNEQVVLQ